MFNTAKEIPFLYEFHHGILWPSQDHMILNVCTLKLETHETMLSSSQNQLLIYFQYPIDN